MPADVRFATWLLDHLTAHVQAELARHLMGNPMVGGDRRRVINGFVIGATSQISSRLTELRKAPAMSSDNSRALVVTKKAAIQAKMDELGVNLCSSTSRRQIDDGSIAAGRSAGDRASFGRPVSGQAAALRIGGGK